MGGLRNKHPVAEAWVDAIVADLVARRLELNYSQQYIAAQIGTSQSAISDMETGEVFPGLELVIRYALVVNARVCIVDKGMMKWQ